MGHHDLKTWPVPFDAVASGIKRHEIRKNDRNYHNGDTLLLREWSPEGLAYSGRERLVRVTYITEGGQWGIPEGTVVMSIEPLSPTAPPADPRDTKGSAAMTASTPAASDAVARHDTALPKGTHR